jgi:hypothetical protein
MSLPFTIHSFGLRSTSVIPGDAIKNIFAPTQIKEILLALASFLLHIPYF